MGSKRSRNRKAWAARKPTRKRTRSKPPANVARPEFTQVATLIVERELGLSHTDLPGLTYLASRLPFEPTMFAVATLAVRAEDLMDDRAAQMDVAREFFAEADLLGRLDAIVSAASQSRVIFGPQSLYTLMRLLIDHAYDAPIGQSLTLTEARLLERAVVASNSAVQTGIGSDANAEQVIAFELQVGAYYSRPQPLEDLTRHHELHRLATTDPGLLASPDCEPVARWVESTGLTYDEQWQLGFMLAAHTPAMNDNKNAVVTAGDLNQMLDKASLLSRKEEAVSMVASDRAAFRTAFAGLNANGPRAIWELRPFNTTPFLQLSDGGLMLLGRPWMRNWLGQGAHYRCMTIAQQEDRDRTGGRRNHVQNYTAYMGQVFERYCLTLAERAIASPWIVLGEQAYGKGGGLKTSDIAVASGSDLILFEANARRLGAEPLVGGDPMEATEELSKLVVKKLNQLGLCIEALLAEDATLPEISIKDVKRIWPVVIAAGHVWQTSGLWAYLDSARDPAKCKSLGSPRVRPVQLFDAPDFEMFLALVRHGSDPITLLKHKTEGPFRHCDLAVWLANDPKAPNAHVRLPALEAVFDEMTTSVAGLFGVMHTPRGSSSRE